MYLDKLSMTEFQSKVKQKNLVVILPIGAVEAHGPHIPLSTDSLQPEYIAEQVVRSKKLNVLIAPPIRYANCQSTRNYPGTISVSHDSIRAFVMDILLELIRNGVKNIVILSGHAGSIHMAALRQAAQDVVDIRDVKIMVLSDYDFAYDMIGKDAPLDDGHAGMIETSRVMAISPRMVHRKNAKKSTVKIPRFRVLRNPEKYWDNATHGDPAIASSKFGRKINKYIIDNLITHIQDMVS